jgi:type I restriction enzyme M protein
MVGTIAQSSVGRQVSLPGRSSKHPRPGTAGFVLANGTMSSNQSGEGDIRKALVKADLVDCMVSLPGQLFYCTQIKPQGTKFLTRKTK